VEGRYPIRAVGKITGLGLDTIRAWERRYKAVVPERSVRGRQYSPGDIERLKLLSGLVQRGHAIGGIASLSDQQLRNLTASAPLPTLTSTGNHEILHPVLVAVESFDAARAADEMGRLAAILAPRELVYQVVLPLMREVGTRWHDGRFAIAQEHLVSQILRNLVGGMMRSFRPSSPAVRIVLATPAGELHEFGILCAAMLLSVAGIEPVYLGPNLPAAEIAAAVTRVSAKAVLLGTTVIADSTVGEIERVAREIPESAELWIGGAGTAHLDLSRVERPAVIVPDLPGLEKLSRRWSLQL
jgi:methanogenic corrinoid protein MtbC1